MTIEAFRAIIGQLRNKYLPVHEGVVVWDGENVNNNDPDYNMNLPPWICQPYIRPPPAEHKQMLAEKQEAAEKCPKPKFFDKEGNAISRKRMKKLKRLEKRANIKIERHGELCTMSTCDNTRGLKCDFNYCRLCCRKKCFNDATDCLGHKLLAKGKRKRLVGIDDKEMKTYDKRELAGPLSKIPSLL
jgi:tRNA-dihydrouridine synthase 1